jgi:DNA-binding CsgD family transcriptional regulator
MGLRYNGREVLTMREAIVLEARLRGLSIKAVAAEMGLSVHTVRHHLEAMHKKLGVHSFQELVFKLQEIHCRSCKRGLFARLKRAGQVE